LTKAALQSKIIQKKCLAEGCTPLKPKKDNDLPKVAPRQQQVLRRENALKARQGGRFEYTANKLFKFHDVIARLHA
jgi:hypothetical protein